MKPPLFFKAAAFGTLTFLCNLNIAHATIIGNLLQDRQYPTDFSGYSPDYSPAPFVVDFHVGQAGTLSTVYTWGQTGSDGRAFDVYVLHPVGGNSYLVEYDSGALTVVSGVGVKTFTLQSFALEEGDLIAHYGLGIPFDDNRHTGTSSMTYDTYQKPTLGQTLDLGVVPLGYAGWRVYSLALEVGSGTLNWNLPSIFPEGYTGGSPGPVPVPEPSTYLAGIFASIVLVSACGRGGRRKATQR